LGRRHADNSIAKSFLLTSPLLSKSNCILFDYDTALAKHIQDGLQIISECTYRPIHGSLHPNDCADIESARFRQLALLQPG
jgi:hypothetical protein